jgi:exonuclease III
VRVSFRLYGVAVYSKEALVVKRHTEGYGALELVSFEFSGWLVIGLYKSPTCARLNRLLEVMDQFLLERQGMEVIIMGDFNVDLYDVERADGGALRTWMEERHLSHRDVGTTTHRRTAIDQIWTSAPLGSPTQTVFAYYSDHLPLLASLPRPPAVVEQLN